MPLESHSSGIIQWGDQESLRQRPVFPPAASISSRWFTAKLPVLLKESNDRSSRENYDRREVPRWFPHRLMVMLMMKYPLLETIIYGLTDTCRVHHRLAAYWSYQHICLSIAHGSVCLRCRYRPTFCPYRKVAEMMNFLPSVLGSRSQAGKFALPHLFAIFDDNTFWPNHQQTRDLTPWTLSTAVKGPSLAPCDFCPTYI